VIGTPLLRDKRGEVLPLHESSIVLVVVLVLDRHGGKSRTRTKDENDGPPEGILLICCLFSTGRGRPVSRSERRNEERRRDGAAVKVPESAGLAISRKNRRLSNHEVRMSMVWIRHVSSFFDILRFSGLHRLKKNRFRPVSPVHESSIVLVVVLVLDRHGGKSRTRTKDENDGPPEGTLLICCLLSTPGAREGTKRDAALEPP
jgi:hypothetical protein